MSPPAAESSQQDDVQQHPGSRGSCSPEDCVIRIEHLSKTFKDKQRTVTAVDDVTFDVKRGEIFGLLGPNGAGKSTLIRILTTLLSPTSGTAFVDRYEITKDPEKIRGIIGVCPQNSTLDNELTAYDNLEFYGKLEDVDDRILPDRIWELLAMVELTDRAHMKVQTFSGGMKRKLEIVRAFIHKPLILFLDEPTIGLDPESRREVWQQIENLNRENTTIILTTHYMDEAEKLCGRIAFVDRGRLISLDTMDNLRLLLPAGDLIEIGFERMDDRVLDALRQHPLVISATVKEQQIHISARSGNTVLPAIVAIFDRYSVPLTSIAIRSPSLEDVFIYLTGKNLSGDSGGSYNTSGSGGAVGKPGARGRF
ncbi:MAG: daunorubicin ABC transporter ATP-binding protein [Methanomicrobiales archaeon HGW-Methanomicrobiales-1]|jgi:ABC-2 type transport system ATP-binding protein|nr:MAG: daunorubicin ABC transporter ATP-binding protein [Methanomicrobiales archaeon HGW-Methanomicrobiales-1]